MNNEFSSGSGSGESFSKLISDKRNGRIPIFSVTQINNNMVTRFVIVLTHSYINALRVGSLQFNLYNEQRRVLSTVINDSPAFVVKRLQLRSYPHHCDR